MRTSVVGEAIVFVVIFVSVEKRSGAFGGTEPAAGGAVAAVRAEVAAAHDATIEADRFLGFSAVDAAPFERGHSMVCGEIFCAPSRSIIFLRLSPDGGVAQMVRAGVS